MAARCRHRTRSRATQVLRRSDGTARSRILLALHTFAGRTEVPVVPRSRTPCLGADVDPAGTIHPMWRVAFACRPTLRQDVQAGPGEGQPGAPRPSGAAIPATILGPHVR